MIFTSFEFVFFFLLVWGIRSRFTNFSAEKWFLLLASYLFYMSWSASYVVLILGASLMDYGVGRLLGVIEGPGRRKALLAVSLVLNLGLLCFFKYTNFLAANLSVMCGVFGLHVAPHYYSIVLPVGISFFTFQSMSYTIDVYRRKLQPCLSMRDFLLFVAFFPQLESGPIVRASYFLPQLLQRARATLQEIESGLAQIALGAVKKMVLSDRISPHVDMIFADPARFDALSLLLGAVGYAIQIYCDFSGYTDMAIGCARILGFRFVENFQMPYSSVNITEFWHRWHISLSTWLRDYLYIPLGGNRRGTVRTYVNLMITMVLGGLWHGAGWNFIIWGGLHGVGLVAHKLWSSRSSAAPPAGRNFPAEIISRLLTLGLVVGGWIFFRTRSMHDALDFLGRILTWNTAGTRFFSPQILTVAAAVVLVHVMVPKDYNWSLEIPRHKVPVRILAYAVLTVLLALFAVTEGAPFIYFQF
jgi:alginate O-acetyltransferase complex protein AlgI